MRRRVGFARAIAHEPEILLFDEPTTGLDPVTTAVVGEVIAEIREKTRATTVTISHDLQSAFKIGDRIAMLHGGKIIAAAPPREFQHLQDPASSSSCAGPRRGRSPRRRLAGSVHVLSLQGRDRRHAGPGPAGLAHLEDRGHQPLPGEGHRVDASFTSVAGLDDKSAVRVAGVRVGRVDGIRLEGPAPW
jgi:ABC-type glutathione transport system ATPase component